MRNIDDYEEKYSIPTFEEIKVKYRRKLVQSIINKYKPKNILEIGCGNAPLFQYVENVAFTIVEPSKKFFKNALEMAKGRENIVCIQGFFESQEVREKLSGDFDLIICSSLLHEVEYPQELLKAIVEECQENTIVHINVPNANSMHRLLGVTMNLISNNHDKTENDILMQHNTVFDKHILSNMVLEAGMEVIDEGSYFIKPFSHAQMFEMYNLGLINEDILDGLNLLTKYMPDYGSEIYVNCKRK